MGGWMDYDRMRKRNQLGDREALREKPWQEREIWALMKRAEPAMRDELMAAWAVRDDLLARVARVRALHTEASLENHDGTASWLYCAACTQSYPCVTIRAVVGTQTGEQT